jgi:MmyB-like transcription regulator ligand binding domain
MEAAEDPDDPRLAALAGELSVQDPGFSSLWSAQHVTTASHGAKHFHHPVVGDLTLDCDSWDSPDGHDQRLLVFTAEPGTPSDHALRFLSARTALRGANGHVPAETPKDGPSS